MAAKKKTTKTKKETPVEEPAEDPGVELELEEQPHLHFVAYVTKRPTA